MIFFFRKWQRTERRSTLHVSHSIVSHLSRAGSWRGRGQAPASWLRCATTWFGMHPCTASWTAAGASARLACSRGHGQNSSRPPIGCMSAPSRNRAARRKGATRARWATSATRTGTARGSDQMATAAGVRRRRERTTSTRTRVDGRGPPFSERPCRCLLHALNSVKTPTTSD